MRTKKALLNTVTALFYQIILTISGLIVPRLILQFYGSDVNGVMSSATQFMSVIGFLTIGLAGAVRGGLYKSLAENDEEKTNQLMSATTGYMNKVLAFLVIYTVAMAMFFPYITKSALPKAIVMALVVVAGVNKFVEQLLGVPYCILLQADQRNYVENILRIISCIIYTIISVVMIRSLRSVVSVKFMSAGVTFIFMFLMYLYAKKTYHLKRSRGYDRTVLSQRKDVAVHSIADLVHQNSDLIILTLFENMKIISVYSVYYYVVGQVKNILSSFTAGLEAAFGSMWAKKEYKQINKRFGEYEIILYSFVIIIFSCFTNLILSFIGLYTKEVTDINYMRPLLAYLIVVAEMFFCIRQPYVTLVIATGKYRETKNIAVLEALVNVCLSLLLVHKYGIIGVVIGTLCANMVKTSGYIYFISKKVIVRKLSEAMYKILWLGVTFLLVMFVSRFCLKFVGDIDSWGKWVMAGCLEFFVSSALTVLSGFIFFKREMIVLKDIVCKVLRK